MAPNQSTTAAYAAGGIPTSSGLIVSFPFAASAPFTATTVGSMSVPKYGSSGHSSTTDAYISGGFTTTVTNIIEKFPFAAAAPFSTSTVGTLTVNKYQGTGQSSITTGYNTGGVNASSIPVTAIYSFPFAAAAPFTTTTAGNLSQARAREAAQSSVGSGYTSGGLASPTVTAVVTIDAFPFTAPFTTATSVGSLSSARQGSAGQQY